MKRGERAAHRAAGCAEPGTRRRRRIALRVGSAVVLGLGIAEAVLRTGYHEQLKRWTHPDIYQHDDLLGYRYRPGAVSRIDWPSISKPVTINDRGYYGPHFEIEKPPGTFRVVVVGASGVGGLWLDGERSFAEQLQAQLRAAGHAVECLALSIDGRVRGTSLVRQVRFEVPDYAPDLVLLQIGIPYFGHVPYRTSHRGYGTTYGHSGMKPARLERSLQEFRQKVDELEDASWWFYDTFYLARAFYRWWDRRDPTTRGARDRRRYQQRRLTLPAKEGMLSVEESGQRLESLQKAVARQGSELILFQVVIGEGQDPSARQESAVAAFAERVGMPFLTCFVPSDRRLIHAHDGHLNEAGHGVVAAELRERLADRWPR